MNSRLVLNSILPRTKVMSKVHTLHALLPHVTAFYVSLVEHCNSVPTNFPGKNVSVLFSIRLIGFLIFCFSFSKTVLFRQLCRVPSSKVFFRVILDRKKPKLSYIFFRKHIKECMPY